MSLLLLNLVYVNQADSEGLVGVRGGVGLGVLWAATGDTD